MPALNAGLFRREPRPMVTTIYRLSTSLDVGLRGSPSVADSSAPAAAGGAALLGLVRMESGRLRRAADEGLPLRMLASNSIGRTKQVCFAMGVDGSGRDGRLPFFFPAATGHDGVLCCAAQGP
jgi:hypothetical protein